MNVTSPANFPQNFPAASAGLSAAGAEENSTPFSDGRYALSPENGVLFYGGLDKCGKLRSIGPPAGVLP